tara:strand:- start:9701 stop:10261 length:561 start_codon:yes stop_codon:yes gene_type:complete
LVATSKNKKDLLDVKQLLFGLKSFSIGFPYEGLKIGKDPLLSYILDKLSGINDRAMNEINEYENLLKENEEKLKFSIDAKYKKNKKRKRDGEISELEKKLSDIYDDISEASLMQFEFDEMIKNVSGTRFISKIRESSSQLEKKISKTEWESIKCIKKYRDLKKNLLSKEDAEEIILLKEFGVKVKD